jgi:hypothetical protein
LEIPENLPQYRCIAPTGTDWRRCGSSRGILSDCFSYPVQTESQTTSQCKKQGKKMMNTFTTKDGTSIFYKDWGTGPVVTFSHGWPLSADAWDAQMLFLGQHGYRVIAHDRRGHGRSGQTGTATTWINTQMILLRSWSIYVTMTPLASVRVSALPKGDRWARENPY